MTELGVAQSTASVQIPAGQITEILGLDEIVFDGAPVEFHFICPSVSSNSPVDSFNISLYLYDGEVSDGVMYDYFGTGFTGSIAKRGITCWTRIVPSAGPHTYSVRAYNNDGSTSFAGGIGGGNHYFPKILKAVTVG
jgi:hypothetical protein